MPAVAVALCALWPAVRHACAVCVAATERNRGAFCGTTVLLSVLPLGMIGADLWWPHRRGRGVLAGEFEERDALPAGETAPESKWSRRPLVSAAD